MSTLRGYKIFTRKLPNSKNSIIVESVHNNSFLLIQQGAAITLEPEIAENFKKSYEKFVDAFGLLGILRLSQDELYLLAVVGVFSVGQLYNCDVYKITNVQCISLDRDLTEVYDPRIVELQRLLSSGSFYFAHSSDRSNLFDITVCTQKRFDNVVDYRFFWNRTLCFPLEKYGIDPDSWLIRCMCGSVLIRTIYVGHRTARVAIISRLSCERVGTRFNVRGVNDDGHVANFVESEQLILYEEQESSFVQIRGSVPLFWEQPGIQVGSHKVKLRTVEISMPAFERHFQLIKKIYGNISTVNLLGSKEGEKLLSTAFQTALKGSSHVDVPLIPYDYHAQMKISKESINELLKKLEPLIKENQFFHKANDCVYRTQMGVIRTNCLDCLDRTNSVQILIGMKALTAQLADLKMDQVKGNIITRFEEVIKDLWIKNGDQCSVIYAGTGALEGKSKFKDASRSLARTIQNNLMDSSKQEAFDLFLFGCNFGNHAYDKAANLVPSTVLKGGYYFYECPGALEALVEKQDEISTKEKLSVFAGTWNVNGGKNMYNVAFRHEQSLEAWIFPTLNIFRQKTYDIIAIGLEEIVDLNASNLMKASTTNQRVWRDGIRKSIIDATNEKYVVAVCEQLVGVCLLVFLKPIILPRVRDLCVDEVKTGMGGATGNKGSIAVRMTVDATSLCFVCSHFAAGQHEVSARNEDFMTAWKKIRFPMGRTIDSHDVVFWLGDFNYRVSLSGDDVKSAVRAQNFSHLAEYDQLTQQRLTGAAFPGFLEGPLNFAPTYKYDTFSDDYDTSEKCRAPAWTDRVLWLDQSFGASSVHLIYYGRSELKTSDHRPVGAMFEVDVYKPDPSKVEDAFQDVISSLGPPDGTILCWIDGEPNFPQILYKEIFDKVQQLNINILLSKIQGADLWLVLPSGSDALAALSMDDIALTSGHKLHVRLKSPDWAEDYMGRFPKLFKVASAVHLNMEAFGDWNSVNINLDDDDDDGGIYFRKQNDISPVSSRSDVLGMAPSPRVEQEILVNASPRFAVPPPPPRNTSGGPPFENNEIPKVPPRPSPLHWPPPNGKA